MSGTSMASPHVTGLVGLIKSQDPERPAHAIKNLLMLGGEEISATSNRTISGKRIRAWDADGVGRPRCDAIGNGGLLP